MSRAALLVTLFLALACGRDDAGERATSAPRAAAAQAAAQRPAPPPAIELPPPGEARAVRSGERYAFASNGAPTADALGALAAEAHFEVEGEPAGAGAPGARLELRDVGALDALRAILAEEAWVAHFAPDAAGHATLARVRVGAPAPSAAPEEPPRGAAGHTPEPPAPHASPPEDEAETDRRAAVERDWQDARDSVRLEAVDAMEPDLDAEKLAALVRADPSPEVRAAAAEVLSEGDAFSVTEPLLGALEDRDPSVVLAAVRSLEDVYDAVPNPRIRERIAALREHQDANVRAAVADFEEWIAP
jgi:hypothetical protein